MWDKTITQKIIKRILGQSKIVGSCYESNACIGTAGYPMIYIKEIGAAGNGHRIIYFLCNGFIPNNKCVMHSCDNKKCINPKHLVLGTNADNLKDMREKGRHFFLPIGEQSFNAKIKDIDVLDIRNEAAKGVFSYSDIAKKYNLHPSHISRIVRGKTRLTADGNINNRLRRIPVTAEQAELVYELRGKGCTWVKICEDLNLSRSAIMRAYTKVVDLQRHMKSKHSAKLTSE